MATSISSAPGHAWVCTYLWLDLLNGVIFGYIPTALVILRRGILRDLHVLRPFLSCSEEEFRSIAVDITRPPTRRLVLFGTLGFLLFGLLPIFDPTFFGDSGAGMSRSEVIFFMVRSALTGLLAGHAVVTEVHSSLAYATLGATKVKVDLLATRPLHAFAKKGLRSALAWISCVSLISLYWIGGMAGTSNGFIVLGMIVLVLYAFYYSISGVHSSIRNAKERELDKLREQIRIERGVYLDATAGSMGQGGRLPGLIAYHDLVERVPEWPFDAPMALRLALFVTLGIGSWLGGALVERLLEAWL